MLLLAVARAEQAQLVEPGKDDQFASIFLYKPNDAGWVGAVASQGGRELRRQLEFEWQFDYGSLGARKVTPTEKPPLKEAAVSKNSGEHALTYHVGKVGWSATTGWRVGLGAGVEHKRTQKTADDVIEQAYSANATARMVLLRSRKLHESTRTISGGQSAVTNVLITWLGQPAIQTANAVDADSSQSVGPLAQHAPSPFMDLRTYRGSYQRPTDRRSEEPTASAIGQNRQPDHHRIDGSRRRDREQSAVLVRADFLRRLQPDAGAGRDRLFIVPPERPLGRAIEKRLDFLVRLSLSVTPPA